MRAGATLVPCLIVFAALLPVDPTQVPGTQAQEPINAGECEPVSFVAVEKGLAYLGTGARLTVLDVSDGETSQVLGRSDDLAAQIRAVAVGGALVFVALGDAGLAIFDATDPSNPTMVDFLESHPSTFRGTPSVEGAVDRVVIHNNYAYMIGDPVRLQVGNPAQLQIFDLSDTERPINARRAEGLIAGEAYDVAFNDGYAYVAGYLPLLTTLDVSNPTEPTQVGVYEVSRVASLTVAAGGGYVYLINELSRSLDIVDVSNPVMPRRVANYRRPDLWPATIEPPVRALHVTPDGQLVSLSWAPFHDSYDVVVFDVSEPAAPAQVGAYRFNVPGGHRVVGRLGVSAIGGDLYVAAGATGLHLIDMSNPANPILARSFCF